MCVYSVVSVNYQLELEFFSIKVVDGLFILWLQKIQVGDLIILSIKFIGILIVGNLCLGKYLYLLGIGIGLVSFLSIICDLEIYEKFEKVILVYGVCEVFELVYQDLIEKELLNDEFLGEEVKQKLIYYFIVICEEYKNIGCVIMLMNSGKFYDDIGLLFFNIDDDCFMLCGSFSMLKDLCVILDEVGFKELCYGQQVDYVIEWVFVE